MNRQPCRGPDVGRIGDHVRAFEHDGAQIGMAIDERARRLDIVRPRQIDIQRQLVAQNRPREFAPAFGGADRRSLGHAGEREVARREA